MDFKSWWDENWEEVCRYLLIQDKARIIWQASRASQQEYRKHEFCRAMNCVDLKEGKCMDKECELNVAYDWLKDNGYRILKVEQ